MADAKHTPGPWMYQGTNPWQTGGADGGGEFVQWSTFTVSANTLDREDENFYFVGTVSNVNDESQNEANARLIAAAPELLELLQRGLCMTGPTNSDANLRWFDDVRTAIAKATGSAQ